MDEDTYILVIFTIAVGVGSYLAMHYLHLMFENSPLTYFEVKSREVLLSAPNPYVARVAGSILSAFSAGQLTYYERMLEIVSGATAEVRFYCPLGVNVRAVMEPEVEVVAYHVDSDGVCTLLLRNNLNSTARLRVTVYSYGWELVGDEAFRVYAVLRWVSENLRYIPDPKGSDIIFTPDETLKRGGGDCEDIALATAVLLRALNVSAGVALVNTGYLPSLADHVAMAVKPLTPTFMNNLRVYFGASTVRCSPVTAKGYIILDPVLSASSIIPWCVPYTYRDIVSIASDEYIPLWREMFKRSYVN